MLIGRRETLEQTEQQTCPWVKLTPTAGCVESCDSAAPVPVQAASHLRRFKPLQRPIRPGNGEFARLEVDKMVLSTNERKFTARLNSDKGRWGEARGFRSWAVEERLKDDDVVKVTAERHGQLALLNVFNLSAHVCLNSRTRTSNRPDSLLVPVTMAAPRGRLQGKNAIITGAAG